jgi:TalC/MipB family fructose-6-phosphate aldolase
MEIWLDTTDIEIVKDAYQRGILHGITTNPSVIAKSGKTLEDIIQTMLDIQDGPIAIQVVSENSREMIRQAEILTAHSPRVIIKIPASSEGLRTIHTLTQERIPVMATAIFDPTQALLAYKAGAHYIAPYIGRITDRGLNVFESLRAMQTIQKNYGYETKILAAGIRTKDFVLYCAEHNLAAVTINETIYKELIAGHPGTQEAIDKFSEEWAQGTYSTAIPK